MITKNPKHERYIGVLLKYDEENKEIIGSVSIEQIEPKILEFLKSWIKNRNVNQYVVEESRQKLIYSNDIKDINKYPYIVKECLMPYEKKLKNRRECIKSTRKWYELQWGREKSLFERKKIMYPYKSTNNRF